MLALPAFLFGLVIGSFLNVLVLRRGFKSLGGRSACFSCGKGIAWYDNVPVLSYLLLRGRCRSCGSGISAQYPLVELAVGGLFALVAVPYGGLLLFNPLQGALVIALSFLAIALLVAIAVYDLRHTIIPDAWAYCFGAAALALHAALMPAGESVLLFLLAGPVTALPLFALHAVSRGAWMGLGDAKLALGIGWLLGMSLALQALLLAFMIGAVVAVSILLPAPRLLRAIQRWGLARSVRVASYTMKSEVPFGPFLVAACLVVWISTLYNIPLPLW